MILIHPPKDYRTVSFLPISYFLKYDYTQEGQRCPKRRVAQATIRLAIAVINLETRKEILGHPVKVNVLDVLRNVKLAI